MAYSRNPGFSMILGATPGESEVDEVQAEVEDKNGAASATPETDLYLARNDHTATQKGQLSFSKGDIFKITAKKAQWWQAEGVGDDDSRGNKGYVPQRLMREHVPDSEA